MNQQTIKELETELTSLRGQICGLHRIITGHEEREQFLSEKFRKKEQSLLGEIQSLRDKKPVACSCPVGECRRDPDAIMADKCWLQWCMSRRSAEAILRAGGLPKNETSGT
jgi:hypothetical protein